MSSQAAFADFLQHEREERWARGEMGQRLLPWQGGSRVSLLLTTRRHHPAACEE